MILFIYSVGIVAVLFSAYWSQRAWGYAASFGVIAIGFVFIRFVPFPFGAFIVAAASFPLIKSARISILRRGISRPPDPPFEDAKWKDNDRDHFH